MGVTYYLTRSAFDATCLSLAGIAAEGSELAFDYADNAFLDPSNPHSEMYRVAVARAGEPWITGFDEGSMPGVLAGLGFKVLEDLTFAEQIDRFFAGPEYRFPTRRMMNLAHALRSGG
jgi:O-methyltransferase involved in polyketide biosynthesis